ncbi:GNAT family N-acetyltransferase [Virgibacillus kekensis]|uniref:GNAT family N-acetyltransferase n=1 Tax=Virgibacillus kekensis TaxID=202261 RepID=A0ABV9DJV5_9BACI
MNYTFQQITQKQAETIAYTWHYDGEYAFYDMEADEEDLAEFVDPEARGDLVYSVLDGNRLIGFFSFARTNDHTLDIGLGMSPDLTGKGAGLEFVQAGLEFAKESLNPQKITLAVAAFNKRAIKVYERAGFEITSTFSQATNGSTYEFVKMEYQDEKE